MLEWRQRIGFSIFFFFILVGARAGSSNGLRNTAANKTDCSQADPAGPPPRDQLFGLLIGPAIPQNDSNNTNCSQADADKDLGQGDDTAGPPPRDQLCGPAHRAPRQHPQDDGEGDRGQGQFTKWKSIGHSRAVDLNPHSFFLVDPDPHQYVDPDPGVKKFFFARKNVRKFFLK